MQALQPYKVQSHTLQLLILQFYEFYSCAVKINTLQKPKLKSCTLHMSKAVMKIEILETLQQYTITMQLSKLR